MKIISKEVFLLLLQLIAGIVFSHAVKVGDLCDQDGEPGAITLDGLCPYFVDFEDTERFKHGTRGFEGIYSLVCCKGKQSTKSSPISSRITESRMNTADRTTSTVRTTTRKNIFTTIDPIVIVDDIETLCDTIGRYPGLATDVRIIGGTEADVGEFPHYAALAYRNAETKTLSFDCGGALISHKHVLTAAHCIKGKLEFVRLGAVRIFKSSLTDSAFSHCRYPDLWTMKLATSTFLLW